MKIRNVIDWENVGYWAGWALATLVLIGVGIIFVWPFLKLVAELFLPI